jgi:predicted enzyme related to lactoylglutathione lyase
MSGTPFQRGTTIMTMNHPVVWFEVLGNDGAKLQTYYSELFGWNIKVEGPGKYGEVDTGSKKGIPGGIAAQYPGTRPWVTIYVAANDIEGTLGRAKQLGGKVVMPATQIPNGPQVAAFEDPEGHVIGLVNDNSNNSAP